MTAGETLPDPAPDNQQGRQIAGRIWSAIWTGLIGLLAIRRGILLSLTVSSGFVFLDAYFQENDESRTRSVEWVRTNWQEPIDQITPSGISSDFGRIMDECSFGSFDTRPPIVGCKERGLIAMAPVSRVTTDFSSPGLLTVPTPGPFSLAAPSPVASPSILDQFGSRERLPGLSDRLPTALPISLGSFREPDETPLVQYLPAIKAWLASPLVVVSVVSSILGYGWAGIVVFVPAMILATALLDLVLRHMADPRILLFVAVIIQVYLAGIGLLAVGLKSVILLVIGAIQWTLQSVIFINIVIQAADKVLSDRESTALQARIIDLEQRVNPPTS